MAKHAGFRRVVFNMGLSLRTQMYGEGNFSDSRVIGEVKKVLTNYVKKQPECAWMNQRGQIGKVENLENAQSQSCALPSATLRPIPNLSTSLGSIPNCQLSQVNCQD